MTGQLTIDGIDVYQEFGVFIDHEGGYDGLLTYPDLKTFAINNWPDEDGVEVDLSSPKLDNKEFTISFVAGGIYNDVEGFFKFISGAYHTYNFVEIGVIRDLKLTSTAGYAEFSRLKTFSLQFADDFPLKDYAYAFPNNINTISDGYSIDGISLSSYAIRVAGGIESIRRLPTIKRSLLISNVVYEAKEVTLNCLLRCPISELWLNYNALLFDLTRPGERTLTIDQVGLNYPCYYRGNKVKLFKIIGERVWLDFDLKLMLTAISLAEGEEIEYLLVTDDEEEIVDDDLTYLCYE